jgi:hypothetical protein
MITMSQKSSVPQVAISLSQALMSDSFQVASPFLMRRSDQQLVEGGNDASVWPFLSFTMKQASLSFLYPGTYLMNGSPKTD